MSNNVIFFRPCGDCNACCSGQLLGDVYGFEMGCGKPCSFLLGGKCTIYEDRPNMCRNYQCAWSQSLFDEEFRPDKTGLMVSVENGLDNQQYLKVIEIWEQVPQENYLRLLEQINRLGADHVYVKYQRRIDEQQSNG